MMAGAWIENVEQAIDGFEWEIVPRLQEEDFGAWYDRQWSLIHCGECLCVAVSYVGREKLACSGTSQTC